MSREEIPLDAEGEPLDPRVLRRLDQAAKRTRAAAVDAARNSEVADLERLADGHWQEIMGGAGSDAPEPGPGQRVWWAAALLLIAAGSGLWWWNRTTPDPSLSDPPTVLDSHTGLQILEPSEEVESFARFQWRGELEPGGWYELTLWDAEGDGAAPLLQEELDATEWTPPSDWAAPRSLRWRVRSFGVDGTPLHETQAETRRRQP